MDRDVDVLVVGGGPAGVIAAYTAAKQGKSVYMTDAKSKDQIGNKTCGDALNLKFAEYLRDNVGISMPHGKEVCDTVDHGILRLKTTEMRIDGDGYVLDRHVYGQRLMKEAESQGAEVLPNRKAVRALVSNGYVSGVVFKNKETNNEETIKAKVTIDASGRNYIVRKTLPRTQFPKLEFEHGPDEIVASYREIIKLNEDHDWHNAIALIFQPEIPEPGYFWIFSKGPKMLNVGIGWRLSVDGKGSNMRKLNTQFVQRYYPKGSYEVIDGAGYTIPDRYPLLTAVGNGFIAAGDAAFQVDPLIAEGHGPALLAGHQAGLFAADAVESGNYSEAKLWGYNQKINELFGVEHIKKQIYTEALNNVGIDGLEFLFKRGVVSWSDFTKLNNGESMSKLTLLSRFIKMAPKYGLMSDIMKIVKVPKVDQAFAKYPSNPEGYREWYNDFFPWLDNTIRSFNTWKSTPTNTFATNV